MSETTAIPTEHSEFSTFQGAFEATGKSLARFTVNNPNAYKDIMSSLTVGKNDTNAIDAEPSNDPTIQTCRRVQGIYLLMVGAMVESLQADVLDELSRPLSLRSIEPLGLDGQNEWDAVFERLKDLATYEDGWNGYSASAPNHTAMTNARAFLTVMKNSMYRPTRVAASAVGGIGITRREKTKKTYVEFFNNGLISALFADDENQTMSTRRIDVERKSFENLISRIKDYLCG